MEAESQKAQSSVLQKPAIREFDRLFGEAAERKAQRPTPPPLPQRQTKPQNTKYPIPVKKIPARSHPPRSTPQDQLEIDNAVNRQLHSRLERRHAAEVYSEIEKTHLVSAVDQRKQDKETSIDPAIYLKKSEGDPLLEAMLRDKQVLRRAYIFLESFSARRSLYKTTELDECKILRNRFQSGCSVDSPGVSSENTMKAATENRDP